MAPFPHWLHPALAQALQTRGILELYIHQAEAANLLHQGKHVVLATSTASGKSLAYHLPVLDALLRDDVSRMPGVERLSTTVGMKTIKRRGRITDCAAWKTG